MDSIIDQAYSIVRSGHVALFWFQEVAMAKFPYGPVVIIVAHLIIGTLGVHAANKGKPRLYWLHSLVLTILACFGGGIITPVILAGRPSIIFANELALSCGFTIWYLVNYCGFDAVFEWKPIKLLVNLAVALWRTNGTINNVNLGMNIKPSIYYPTPLFGPLIGGTLVNCLGAFVPFDKGLAPIAKGTPWPIQSAFVSAALYYFIVKDRDGWIGIAVRSVVGDLSHRAVAGIIVGVQMLTLASQVVFDEPNANFLTPIHQFVYFVMGLQGPPSEPAPVPLAAAAPVAKEANGKIAEQVVKPVTTVVKPTLKPAFVKFLYFVRVLAAVCCVFYFLSLRVPPVTLPAVQRGAIVQKGGTEYVTLTAVPTAALTASQPIGLCQWRALLPLPSGDCRPFALRLEEQHICANDTCEVQPECQVSPRTNCTQAALHSKRIERAQIRLAVHPSAGHLTTLPTLLRTTLKNAPLLNTNMQWSTVLPLQFTSAQQLAAVDPMYRFDRVSLFLTTDSELLLVSEVDFAGSVFDATQISARVLWRGPLEHTCHGSRGASSVTAQALFLNEQTGFPYLRCSDGSVVEVMVGEVYKYRWAGPRNESAASAGATANVAAVVDEAAVGADSVKTEL